MIDLAITVLEKLVYFTAGAVGLVLIYVISGMAVKGLSWLATTAHSFVKKLFPDTD